MIQNIVFSFVYLFYISFPFFKKQIQFIREEFLVAKRDYYMKYKDLCFKIKKFMTKLFPSENNLLWKSFLDFFVK